MNRLDFITQAHVDAVHQWEHFDAEWYLREYADVSILGLDPAYHYLWLGAKIGRRPSAAFTRFPSRRLKVDDLVKAIERGTFGIESAFEEAFSGDHLQNQVAEFIQPNHANAAAVKSMRVAVHAHMYYAELAEEFALYLSQMPCSFDLFASTASEETCASVTKAFSSVPSAALVDVRVVPNVGRDIAPFLVEFGANLAQYDVIAHIQTKKSLYNSGATDGWREYILNSLFEDQNSIASYISLLQTGRYGIIYPQCFYNLPYMANTWLANAEMARTWAPRLGIEVLPEGYFDFPAGSMFWARTDALRPLLEANLHWSDFPPEHGQTDGTLAHCMERMLGVVPTSRHFRHGVIRDTQTPSWSRWRLNQFTDRPLSHLHAMISDPRTKIVAFDIFDTLLTRPFLDPDYVKYILQEEYEEIGLPGFRDIRRHSEHVARGVKGLDVDIHDIYQQISHSVSHLESSPMPDREINLEIRSVRLRPQCLALLKFAESSRKKVVLISDMFLPRIAIEEMLKRCGVEGWDTLYLSSEVGVRKDSGKLYEHVLARERLSADQMVMIGDNERSDFQIPADMGIRTIHLIKPTDLMRSMPRMAGLVPDAAGAGVAEQFLFGAIAARNFAAVSYDNFSPHNMFGTSADAIGYCLLGPIIVSFSQWLVDQANEHRLNRLLFLAREGKFLKEAFDGWVDGRLNSPRSDYLLISRRAVTVPCIRTIDDIFDIAASNDFHGASMATFLYERFGTVLKDELWAQCHEMKLWSRGAPLTIVDGDIRHIRSFLQFIAPHIFTQAANERETAINYYHNKGLDTATNERMAVVDVGYGATIQRHLIKLMDVKVHGLYMMTDSKGAQLKSSASVLVEGYFASGVKRDLSAPPMFAQSFLLEKMLSADDEQVMSYAANGAVEFRTQSQYPDLAKTTRSELQRGAINFVKDASRFRDEMNVPLQLSKTHCEELFSRFVLKMSDAEKEVFAALALDDFYCGRGMVIE